MISGPSNAIDVPAQGSETGPQIRPAQPGGRRQRTRVPASAPPDLVSTDAAATATGLRPAIIQRWQLHGAVVATQPAAGTGHRAGWSHRDILQLEQIANVRRDLTALGLPCPHTLVKRLWDDLTHWDEAHLYTATVTISIRLAAA